MLKRNATDFFRFFCEIRVLQDKSGKKLLICGQIYGQNLRKISFISMLLPSIRAEVLQLFCGQIRGQKIERIHMFSVSICVFRRIDKSAKAE